MFARRMGNRIIARLQQGEEVIGALREICLSQHVSCAKMTAIGTLCDLEINGIRAQAHRRMLWDALLPGTMSLSGYIATRPEGIYISLHAWIIGEGRQAVLARLSSCRVRTTCELVIDLLDNCIPEEILKNTCRG